LLWKSLKDGHISSRADR